MGFGSHAILIVRSQVGELRATHSGGASMGVDARPAAYLFSLGVRPSSSKIPSRYRVKFRHLSLAAFLFTMSVSAAGWAAWRIATEVAVEPGSPKTIVFVNSHTGIGIPESPPDVWHRVDLSGVIPQDAQAAALDAWLIITHGVLPEVADLTLAFRLPGDTTTACSSYRYETVEGNVNGGQRQVFPTYVPVDHARFEFCWTRSTRGEWPQNSSYAVNLKLTGWIR